MDFKENKAIYLQLADLFCENIILGKWKENERIPSVREIAAETEVNPNTVMRTYTHLQDMNIIFNKRGVGYFVSEGALDQTLKVKKEAFVKTDLPQTFNTMDLLKMEFSELKKYYEDFKKIAHEA